MVFLLMYGSHDMRHTGFPQVDGGQQDPREMGRHIGSQENGRVHFFFTTYCGQSSVIHYESTLLC